LWGWRSREKRRPRRLAGATRFLTHCNAGALVTPGLGTALAPIYVLHGRGEPVHVWVDETRPLLQGLRLTHWELARAGIAHRVLVDGAAASLFAGGAVDAVIVGADRVCSNGDVANKVGTYGLAVLARHHDVPFFVAAPLTTLDPATASGHAVPIEERPGDEARYLRPEVLAGDVETYAPAFDVTPAALVTALLTDAGPIEEPDKDRLAPLMEAAGRLQPWGAGGR
ncbi:MAG: S-methyl-5-thioribose-1-phosphate isomerase, partial [Planctomycetota bacterium]